ncbi:Na+/H+ antiporter [Paraflavitalea sp. CAU 1676]|uniref:Na+/H+ antiporter n=1 Tax=Paraflavitalea sp. CAU 1676 TaxID=3032598 RepID=UPI0023DBAF1C|nr:Na+/H+ antiporter [Paraflavitalea sp. CAU 1676]MDF2191250.1 Na+/H+ antiporter [Paraflavitalea sp. CAU 1676]
MAVLISLSAFIDKLKMPYPVLLVLTGLVIGFIPLPPLTPNPDIIFLVFLPPLLYDAALRTSWREFRKNIRPISALGISLVFCTTIVVAITAYYCLPQFTWPLAFLLGAIVSPPDATAAAGIIKGLGLSKRLISILEGESLVNDAAALIAYRYALTASITGVFVIWQAGLQFLVVAGGGVLVGLAVGYLLIFLHKKITNHSLVETSLTLLSPFISYLLAEELHTSGILAVVCTGLMVSWRAQEIFSYQTRMRTRAVWDTITFLMNGFLFILIGLQLPVILGQLSEYSIFSLIGYGLIISLATILVRVVWVFAGAYSLKLSTRLKKRNPAAHANEAIGDSWKNVLIVSWTGTRGVISMAAALALPLSLPSGQAFPQRHLILFVCFVVIFMTLVVQGFSLPLLIRLLGIKPSSNEEKEVRELQLLVVLHTLEYIERVMTPQSEAAIILPLKNRYEQLMENLREEIILHTRNEVREERLPVRSITKMQDARINIGLFQRDLLLQLHKEGKFSEEAVKQVEREMDIDELQFEQSLPR